MVTGGARTDMAHTSFVRRRQMDDVGSSDTAESLPGLPGLVVKQRINLTRTQVTKLVAPLHKAVMGLRKGQDLPVWLTPWLARTTDSLVFAVKSNGKELKTHIAIPYDSHCTVEMGSFFFVVAPVRRGPLEDSAFFETQRIACHIDKELSQRMENCAPTDLPSNEEFFRLMSESARLDSSTAPERRTKKRRKAERDTQ